MKAKKLVILGTTWKYASYFVTIPKTTKRQEWIKPMPIDQDTKHIDQTESGFQPEAGLPQASALQQENELQQ